MPSLAEFPAHAAQQKPKFLQGGDLMSQTTLFPVPEGLADQAWVDEPTYRRLYELSIKDPERFWAEQGQRISWMKPYTKVKDVSYKGDVHIRWFYDGTLNACWNCVDRHLATRADQVAIIWEGDNPAESK